MDILKNVFDFVLNNEIIKFLLSLLSQEPVRIGIFIFKILGMTISVVLFVAFIYFLIKSNYIKMAYVQDIYELLMFRPWGQKKLVKKWEGISDRLERGSEAEHKLAVIEAEQMLDEVFIRMGFGGQSFGERLTQIREQQLPSIDEVVEAHKTRNNIVHDPDYKLTPEQAKKVLNVYEKALKELEVF